MKLARTYLEMGMVDEAIASLQTAVRSPRQRFEAAAAPRPRVRAARRDRRWPSNGSNGPPRRRPRRRGRAGANCSTTSASLLDGAGETSRALAVFLELQADAGDYRDVPARIDRLARVQTGG